MNRGREAMSDTYEFVPSAAKGVAQNMNRFIQKARLLKIELGSDFDADVWSKRVTTVQRASTSGMQGGVQFVTLPDSHKGRNGVAMSEPFKDFAKAVIRNDEFNKLKVSHNFLIMALRYIYWSLEQDEFDPIRIRREHLDRAARHLRANCQESTAYAVGSKLAAIAKLLRDNNLTLVSFTWKNPHKRPKAFGGPAQIGFSEEAIEYHSERMLTPLEIAAIGEVATRVETAADKMCLFITILLLCGGFRINECLSMPADCLVREVAIDDFGAPKRDVNGEEINNIGLRYWPEKGGHTETAIKWIPSSLKDVVEHAIQEIKCATYSSRENARWLKENEGRAVLPSRYCDLPLDASILVTEAESVLGCDLKQSVHLKKFRKIEQRGEPWFLLVGELHRYLRSRSALRAMVVEPVVQEIEDSLFVVPANFTHMDRREIFGTVVPITDQVVRDFLGGRIGSEGLQLTQSVFERFGIFGEDGKPIRISTHEPRHFLHTTLVEGGLPELLLAQHFGRREIAQNNTYDHTTPVQRARKLAENIGGDRVIGGLKRIIDDLESHDRKNFRETVVATAHRTDFGFCIHDWASMPCLDHGRCIGCVQLIVVKGDPGGRARVEEDVADSEWLLERAVEAAEDEIAGADNHRAHLERVVSFGRAILNIHDDPAIPDGTLVHVTEKKGAPV